MKNKEIIRKFLPIEDKYIKCWPVWIKDKVKVLNSISLAKCPFPIRVAAIVNRYPDGRHEFGICSYLIGTRHRISGRWTRVRTRGKSIHKHDKPRDIINLVHKDMKFLLTHELAETFQLKTEDGLTIPFDPHEKKD
jgi:hypothetical protein